MFVIGLIARPEVLLMRDDHLLASALVEDDSDTLKEMLHSEFICAETILSYFCRELHRADTFDFIVSGFGQPRWPCDVRTELSSSSR